MNYPSLKLLQLYLWHCRELFPYLLSKYLDKGYGKKYPARVAKFHSICIVEGLSGFENKLIEIFNVILEFKCGYTYLMNTSEYSKFNKVWIVMPAFNAEKTLEKTYFDIPLEMRANVLLVDDGSTDRTVQIANSLDIEVIVHSSNLGYGANQKTCYENTLNFGAEVVIMIHPDYQYDARCAKIMAEIIMLGNCDVLLGNRIRTRHEALSGGMPKWKYFLNRISTLIENILLGQNLGDFHSGMRAYSRATLEAVPFKSYSNDFRFDQQVLVQCVALNLKIGDIPVPVRYSLESSSINLSRSIVYGWGGITTILGFLLSRNRFLRAFSAKK